MTERSRVILANRPRLVRELLAKAIRKRAGLRLVAEVTDLTRLPSAVEQTEADWIVVSLPPGGEIPTMITLLLADHPSVCVLAVAANCGQARVRCRPAREHALEGLSLTTILDVLQEWPSHSH
jgi:hypothetical protein